MLEQKRELVKLLFMCNVIRTKGMTDYLFFVLKDEKSLGLKDIRLHLNNGHCRFCLV